MRVLLVSSGWPPITAGGAEAYVTDLAAALRGRGHEVAGLTLGLPGPDVAAVVPARPHRLDQHVAAPWPSKLAFHAGDVWRPATGAAVRRALGGFRPDVVHTHVVAGMSVRALTDPSRSGAAHVHTLHDYWLRCWRSTGTRSSQQPCGPACHALARARAIAVRRSPPHVLLGISQAVLDRHASPALGIRDARVVRHPAHAHPPARGRRAGAPVFGFLGQLNPNKGVRVLLAAAARLGGEAPPVVIAGRGRLAEEVASAPSVDARGWVTGSTKERFFADVDCLIVPSLWEEPAGLVALEAAVRGVPVIASRVGGLPEYVPSSCRSLLFPAGDVDALVDRMRAFTAQPDAYVVDPVEVPTWDTHLDALMAAYDAAQRHAGRVPA